MKILGYIVGIIILVALGLFLYSLKNQKNTMNPTNAGDWSGNYRYYYQVPNADDGTTDYRIVLVKNGAGYDVTFKESGGKVQSEYSAKGTFDNMGDLEVRKGNELMFTLLPAAHASQGDTNLILKWPPRDGKPAKAIVFEKQ